MTPKQFYFWLKGYFDLQGIAHSVDAPLTAQQVWAIKQAMREVKGNVKDDKKKR